MNQEPTVSDLERMLELHDEAFISFAYEAILFRPPDLGGRANYLSQLRAGVDRQNILEELAESPESREKRANLNTIRQHLSALKKRSKRFKPGLIRRLLDATSNPIHQQLRAIENRLMGLEHAATVERDELQRLESHIRHLAPDFISQGVAAGKAAGVAARTAYSDAGNALIDQTNSHRLNLDADYGVDRMSWQAYCNFLLANRLKEPAPLALSGGSNQVLLIFVDCSHGAASKQALSATKKSIDALSETINVRVSSVWFVPSDTELDIGDFDRIHRSEVAASVGASDLVLVIRPGDEPGPALPQALMASSAFSSDLTLIDSYFCEGEKVFPVLLHGVDPVSAKFANYFFGRFATLGRCFLAALKEFPESSPSDIGARLCASLTFGRIGKQTHIALPLLRLAIDSAEIKAVRERIRVPMPTTIAPKGAREPSVSAIICTKDSGFLLAQLLRHLYESDQIADIVIVSNNTSDIYALKVLEEASKREDVTIVSYKGPFNFSRQCNLGVKFAKGEALLFLNDDITPITEDWLDYMLGWLDAPRVVGPLLIYPDQSVQHAGMFLGFNGVAGHSLRRSKIPHGEAGLMLSVPRHVSCLTGAALLMPSVLFKNLNGFDPMLGTYLQDVDLCLRVGLSGWEMIFEPRAILMHMESVSIAPTLNEQKVFSTRQREFEYFNRRWSRHLELDRWMNPLYDPMDESLRTLR